MNIIVFDTETVGLKTQSLLDIGYRIIDLNLTTLEYTEVINRSYLRRDLYNNRLWMLNDSLVGEEKLTKYDRLVNDGNIILRSLPQMLTTLNNDIARFSPMFGYAYNCAFDIDKIQKACDEIGAPYPFENVPILDIWAFASVAICQTDNYKEWAKENEVFTTTGKFISTSVEAVIKYLSGNLDFIEEHTALDDTQHEVNILIECARRGLDITKPIKKQTYIKSGKIFTFRAVTPEGDTIEFNYTDNREVKDGTIIYN